ncbi:MAG: CRISPR-associated protein Cas4 [Verrucomicrobiae bacterium]|nr:CRISPR-associated protein Cas4 [Verrucomicrobiae bacterium]MCP5541354.1 CRISPR-associated protein Cas4 [Akkermansiaceae bacterium]
MTSRPMSALQHLLFCERQCALIHSERLWAENRLTAEGRVLHDKAHDGPDETRDGIRIVRGLHLHSATLGIHGVADVVEFHRPTEPGATSLPVPVEYKRGRPKRDDCDRVQLCAQALCLEEMLGVEISRGHLFYGRNRRRQTVEFDAGLRDTTLAAIRRLHELLESGETPPAAREPKCDACSLLDLCLPGALRFSSGVAAWNDRQFASLMETEG